MNYDFNVLIASEGKMREPQSKKEKKQQASSQNKKRSVSTMKNIKYIVPMPGRASWLLKSNILDTEDMHINDINSDFTSETSLEHSHLIMNRKFIVD